MRVLHLTTEFPPVIYGGLGTAVGGIVNSSARAGIKVAVLLVGGTLVIGKPQQLEITRVEPGGDTLWSDEFRWEHNYRGYGSPDMTEYESGEDEQVVVGPMGVTFLLVPWNDAVEPGVRLAQEWRPDVIHLQTHWVWPVARAIQERMGTPLVYTVHSIDRAEYEIGDRELDILETSANQEAALAASERVIVLTQHERETLIHYYPWSGDKVRIVGNGIDDGAEPRKAAKKATPDRSLLVIYSGRLVNRKGIAELLAAIPAVLDEEPTTRFILAGGPPGVNGEALKRHWLSPALSPYWTQIHFTGWLAPHQIAELYAAADLLVVPSRYEPFGMVVLEGMLYGLPILAAAVGGPSEILDHGRTGWLFPARDAQALATTLLQLIKKPGLRRQLGRMAALEVRRKWLWPRIVRNVRCVYREAMSFKQEKRYARNTLHRH
jgi:glycogen synthase